MTGHLFGDRYQVGDTLGFGGMSEVHRGRDLRLGRDVAIKVLRADLARDPSFQTRFRREAQNAASLNHPAIVAVYDTGETPGETGTIPYIVMEYVDGETLRDLLKREGSLVPRRAMEIVADVCAALDFSHRHGIVHRDIKPANVMLTRAGAVKVMDFGIARAVADGQATMTATAAVIGTAQYLSPEQARGEAVDARSDVYATGCVLFELLVGAPPFTGDSPVAVAYQHVREDPKAPSEVKPGLPKELDSIVLKALNKNPLNRYQTAAEMRSDLVRALSGQAVLATPVMSDDERTQMMRAAPVRVGVAAVAGPSLLAPPRRPIADDLWEEDKEPDQSKKVWGFVGIGVLCLALLAGAIYLTLRVTGGSTPPPPIATPSVENLSKTQAEKTIVAAGLIVGKESPVESPMPSGTVTKQDPSNGTPIRKGQPVDLYISKGISQVTVPDLTRMTPDQAKAALVKLNLLYGQDAKTSLPADNGLVLLTNPTAGTMVKPKSTVRAQVGSGPLYALIPTDLIGKSYDQAVQKLKALKLNPVRREIDGVEPADKVLKLGPGIKAGQSVQQGTVIPLQVSNNKLFKMPNLANLTPDEAAQRLSSAGWTTGVAGFDQAKSQTQDLTVIGRIPGQPAKTAPDATHPDRLVDTPPQSPAPDAVAPKSTRIKIVVYSKLQLLIPNNFVPNQTPTADVVSQLNGLGFSTVTAAPGAPVAPTPGSAFTFISLAPGSTGAAIDFDTPIVVTGWGAFPPPVVITPTPTPTPPTIPTTTPSTTPATTPTTAPPTTAPPVTPPVTPTSSSKAPPGQTTVPPPGGNGATVTTTRRRG